VTGLIFFVALRYSQQLCFKKYLFKNAVCSEYDQKLYEDETVNRMHESIMLFAEICNCQVLSLILFTSLFFVSLLSELTEVLLSFPLFFFCPILSCSVSQWFKDAALVLFLNKSDLFREKIAKIDLNVCFPDYEGGCDFDESIRYIRRKFVSLNQNPNKKVSRIFLSCLSSLDLFFLIILRRYLFM
jgi:hypothetical protein